MWWIHGIKREEGSAKVGFAKYLWKSAKTTHIEIRVTQKEIFLSHTHARAHVDEISVTRDMYIYLSSLHFSPKGFA